MDFKIKNSLQVIRTCFIIAASVSFTDLVAITVSSKIGATHVILFYGYIGAQSHETYTTMSVRFGVIT